MPALRIRHPFGPLVICALVIAAMLVGAGSAAATTPVQCGTSGHFTVSDDLGVVSQSSCTGTAAVPEGVTYIDSGAFEHSGVVSMSLPASLERVYEYAFGGSNSLTSFTVAGGNPTFTAVDGVLFRTYGAAPDVHTELVQYPGGKSGDYTIPSTVTDIFTAAFAKTGASVTVTIPDSVTSIGSNAFQNTTGITSVTIGNGVTAIGAYTFENATALTSVTIGSGVGTIGSRAFHNTALAAITIPSNVTTIESEAFYQSSGLANVTIMSSTPPSVGGDVFAQTAVGAHVHVRTDATGWGALAPCGTG